MLDLHGDTLQSLLVSFGMTNNYFMVQHIVRNCHEKMLHYSNLPIQHKYVSLIEFGNMPWIACKASFCCWGSPSFIINWTLCLSQIGIRIGTVCCKIHQKMKCFCFQENVRRLEPLIFECDVAWCHISSGQSLEKWNASYRDYKKIWR